MKLAALVLAAGRATRFGGGKLIEPFDGAPLVAHAIRAACAAPVERVVIVRRPEAALDQVCARAASEDARISLVATENEALSDSLRAGLVTMRDCDGVFVFLGDVPLIPPEIPRRVAEALSDRFAVVPTFKGKPGHPVLLSARAMTLAREIKGDQGAGALLREHAGDVTYLETGDERVILDVDTLEDLQRLSRQITIGS